MLSRLLPSLLVGTLLWHGIQSHEMASEHAESRAASEDEHCSDYDIMPPVLPSPETFTGDYQSGLQIYAKSLVVQCEGSIIGWKVVPKSEKINGLHLGVFRPDPSNANVWTVVGDSYVNDFDVESPGQWTVIPLDNAIPVQKGDALGIFYDEYQTLVADLTVGIATPTGDAAQRAFIAAYENADAVVFMRDANQVQKGTQLDASEAVVEQRVGGIAAVFAKESYNPASCDVPLVDDDVSCNPMTNRYTFYTKTRKCEEFNGCERSPEQAADANNHATKEACEKNCVKYIDPAKAAAEQAERNSKIAQAGMANDEARAKCAEPLRRSDWDCPEDPTLRYHYNIYIDMCVPFNGCPAVAAGNHFHNNWNSKAECEATCLGFKNAVTGLGRSHE